jgi:hypothetical protein
MEEQNNLWDTDFVKNKKRSLKILTVKISFKKIGFG